MNTASISIPTNLEEAMIAFKELFSPEDTIEFFRMSEDDLGKLHHSLGQWIRNVLPLLLASCFYDPDYVQASPQALRIAPTLHG